LNELLFYENLFVGRNYNFSVNTLNSN